MAIKPSIEHQAHMLALEFNEMKYESIDNLKFVYEYQYIPFPRKKYIAMEVVKRTRSVYQMKDGEWVLWKKDEEKGGIEFFIDGQTGDVFKPQGKMPAKTPRYNITKPMDYIQMVANKKVSQHGGWLYQDFKNVEVA